MAKARLPTNWLRSARDALLPAASATVVEERHGSESWWGGEIRQRQSSQQQADSCPALTGPVRSHTRKSMFAELADADSPAAHAVVSVADRMGNGCGSATILRHRQPQVPVACTERIMTTSHTAAHVPWRPADSSNPQHALLSPASWHAPWAATVLIFRTNSSWQTPVYHSYLREFRDRSHYRLPIACPSPTNTCKNQ